jgi:hypothetical protein
VRTALNVKQNVHTGPTETKAITYRTSSATSSENAGSSASLPHDESQSSPTEPCAKDPASRPPIGVSRHQELQLMIHYISKTSRTMAHDEEELLIWKEVIPEEAVKHPFLMDGLLAIASLHYAYQDPASRSPYTEYAIRYQNSGLQRYNEALRNVNEENCTALFACSILVNMMAIGLPNTSPDSASSEHTASIMAMVELITGIGLIHLNAIST